MLHSVRVFLSGIIDYAGLFPPEKLPLERAIHNYAEYRANREAWMLGRFVIPATRLAELEPNAPQFSSGPPFVFSVLGRAGDTVDAFLNGIVADLVPIVAFRFRHKDGVVVDAYETKLPAESLPNPTAELIQAPTRGLGAAGMSIFYELPPAASPALFDRLRGGSAGVKLRCGGLEAAAFPSPGEIAHVIAACRENGLTLKFTAGLHHPIRRFDRDLGTRVHGFINVFGAGVLAHVLPLTETQIRAIIEDEDASNFAFDEIGFGWKQYHVLIDEIIAARRQFVTSFGSCSFEEPRDDLRALGILP